MIHRAHIPGVRPDATKQERLVAAVRRDATWYADKYGVTLAQAIYDMDWPVPAKVAREVLATTYWVERGAQ